MLMMKAHPLQPAAHESTTPLIIRGPVGLSKRTAALQSAFYLSRTRSSVCAAYITTHLRIV